MFVNMSNHPVASWGKEQFDTIGYMGYKGPVDFVEKMPMVDPSMSTEGVEQLAQELVVKLLSMGKIHGVMVAGEPLLTYYIINMLFMNDIKCYSATTKRVVTETQNDDGTTTKRSVFNFIQWREYKEYR